MQKTYNLWSYSVGWVRFEQQLQYLNVIIQQSSSQNRIGWLVVYQVWQPVSEQQQL